MRGRVYSEADLALFARHRDQRARVRPRLCKGGAALCWVDLGPPAIDQAGFCIACSGVPGSLPITEPGSAYVR